MAFLCMIIGVTLLDGGSPIWGVLGLSNELFVAWALYAHMQETTTGYDARGKSESFRRDSLQSTALQHVFLPWRRLVPFVHHYGWPQLAGLAVSDFFWCFWMKTKSQMIEM